VIGGPPRKPTKLKLLSGNPGKRPLPQNEPEPQAGQVTRPEFLLPEAKREWNRIVPELQRLGLLTIVDRAALAQYCEWWGRWCQAEAILKVNGITYETGRGEIKPRPEVQIAFKASNLCRAYMAEFGLTPAARTRVEVPDGKRRGDDIDDFDGYLRGDGTEG
jgi:P27 family predicted phage terminase small subunit